MPQKKSVRNSLLESPLKVVNVGAESFADDLRRQNVPVIQMDWSPPRPMEKNIASLLSKLGM